MASLDPDEQRAASRAAWETAATGWGANAHRIREWGMPVSVAMVESLDLQPGQRVLELAAGPGDTGFMAAELIQPGGTLISSDGAEAMVEVARARAAEIGIDNVEFKQLELEWIDLPTASVDALLCRWGIMLIVDPDAAAREARRVLRSGGHAAFAVWDTADSNPWATISTRALVELGHLERPDRDAPGPFRLHGNRLAEVLEGAGFLDVELRPVAVARHYAEFQDYIDEQNLMSPSFIGVFRELTPEQQAEVVERISQAAEPYRSDDGTLVLPGRSLVAQATA